MIQDVKGISLLWRVYHLWIIKQVSESVWFVLCLRPCDLILWTKIVTELFCLSSYSISFLFSSSSCPRTSILWSTIHLSIHLPFSCTSIRIRNHAVCIGSIFAMKCFVRVLWVKMPIYIYMLTGYMVISQWYWLNALPVYGLWYMHFSSTPTNNGIANTNSRF